mmetsp:Transcript_42531/g.70914  ORF Transcript_42531/g.70914 Transcript_42531/m.70914 type:complete len:111 (-) Transcript_42531:18-350(-)
MFMHPENTSSDIQYWRNVFSVGVNGPVLVVNWFAISLISGEEGQLAIVISVTVIVYICMAIYYGGVDALMPANRSLTHNIPLVRERYKERRKQMKNRGRREHREARKILE